MKVKALIVTTNEQLRPLTEYMPKSLVPLAMSPLISYQVKKLKQIGVTEVAITVPHKDIDTHRNIIGDGNIYGMTFTYITCDGDVSEAIEAAKDFLTGNVIMFVGMNVFEGKLSPKVGKAQVYITQGSGDVLSYTAMGNVSGIEQGDGDALTGIFSFPEGRTLVERVKKHGDLNNVLAVYAKESNLAVVKLPGFFSAVRDMGEYHLAQHWAAAKVMWE